MSAVAFDARLPTSASALSPANPFVDMSAGARAGVASYVVVWRILPLVAVLGGSSNALALSGLAEIGAECLLILPILFTRFLGMRTGWLHPLVLPTLVAIGVGILRDPAMLAAPVSSWFAASPGTPHELFPGYPATHLDQARLMSEVMNLLALLSLYAGFALFRSHNPDAPAAPLRLSAWRFFAVFVALVAIVVYFLHCQGGLITHMASFADGRFRMRELNGPFLVANAFLPYMLVLWSLARPRALRHPLFLIAFVGATGLQFVVTGSRTDLFLPILMLIGAWVMVNRTVPTLRVVALGLAAFLMLGSLGEVRRSGEDGRIDLSSFARFDVAEARAATEAEIEGRDRGATVAVYLAVPEDVGHLWGRTYLAAIGFWVPRAFWPDKPRSAGAHTAALIYRGWDTMEGYSGAGYPPDAAAEAYWNFGIPGVALIFALFGGVARRVADLYVAAPGDAVRRTMLLMFVFVLPAPSTNAIVSFLQLTTMLCALVLFARIRGPELGR